jgi:glutaredoxin 2
MEPLNMESLVEAYIKIREKKSQIKAEYESQVDRLDAVQDRIEATMLQRFSEMGIDSVKTPAGTAYAQTRASATVGDWDAFLAYIKQHEAYELIERRVSKAAAEQHKAAHGELPPGVNWSETRVVNFRRN